MLQSFLVFVALLANAGFLPASYAASAPPSPRTFTFRLIGQPETLDWNRAHTPIETYLIMNLMEGLLAFDAKLGVTPSLARSFQKSSDGKTYTFKLRKGVLWSDGVPLKAQDFAYSWRRLISPLTAASYAYLLFDVEGAKEFYEGKLKDFSKVGIKALDDETFQVKLTQPLRHWEYIPTFWVTFPLRQDLVEKYGESWPKPGRMVTVGPFTLAQHDIESRIVLRANPKYIGPRGNLEEAVGLIVKDDSTAVTLYESGKLDFLTDLGTMDLKRLAKHPELKSFPYLKTGYLGFSINQFPASDVHIRRAIAMALDKSVFGSVLHGGQTPAGAFLPPQMPGYQAGIGLKFDPEEAKRELKRSASIQDKAIQIQLVYPNWDKNAMLAQWIQSELAKHLGIQVTLQAFDHKMFRAQLDLHAFASFESSWSADYPDPDNFLSVFLSDSGNNRTNWKNAEYDSLVLKARSLPPGPARTKLLTQAQKILIEKEAAIIPLYYEPNLALVRSRVQGLELNPLNYLFLKKVNLGS